MKTDRMEDIINFFPTAKTLRETPDAYTLYCFEEELKSLCRTILWGASSGYNPINVASLSKEAKEFLEEKGYKIELLNNDTYWISY